MHAVLKDYFKISHYTTLVFSSLVQYYPDYCTLNINVRTWEIKNNLYKKFVFLYTFKKEYRCTTVHF